MQWIVKNKRKLIIVCGISFIIALVELFFFRSRGGELNIRPSQIGFIMLPWVVTASSFMPLVYLSWFKRPHSITTVIILKVFFWLFVVAMTSIWVVIYCKFEFVLW
jgi:hypothetical protein